MARWSLTDSQAGFLFAAEFTGALLGVAAFGSLTRNCGYRLFLVAGYAMMGLGVALVWCDTLLLMEFGLFIAGFGSGLLTPASNLVIALESPTSRAGRLNTLNFMWGIGAVLCPFLVAFAEHERGLRLFFALLAATLVLFAVAFWSLEHHVLPRVTPVFPAPVRQPQTRPVVPVLTLFVTLFFLYVGTENCFGGWAARFAREVGGTRGSTAALMPLFFWGMLILGRASAPAILRRVSEWHVAFAGMSLVLLSSLILLFVSGTTLLALAMALAGLGCSALFPILVAWLTHFMDESTRGLRSLPFASADVGAAILPWLVGIFSTRWGGLRAGFPVVVIAIASMMTFAIFLRRRTGPTRP
jgi:fucose permease